MSFGQPGTLYHAKVILRRADVNGNVKSNYKAHEDLFLLMFKALVHIAAEQTNLEGTCTDREYVLSKIYRKIHGMYLLKIFMLQYCAKKEDNFQLSL